MNEELIDILYDRATRLGYRGAKNVFMHYVSKDKDLFDDVYNHSLSIGAASDARSFAKDIGVEIPKGYFALDDMKDVGEAVKKKAQEEFDQQVEAQKQVETQVLEEPTDSLSEDGASVLPTEKQDAESLSEDGASGLSEYIKAPEEEKGKYTIDGIELSKEDFERQIKETPKEVLQGSVISIENDEEAERLFKRKQYFETDEDLKLPPGMEWMERYIPEPDRIFNNSLKAVDEDLMNTSEDFVVPELNYLFNQYGFDFEETDYLGDGVLVKAPNDKSERFNLDPAFYGAKEEAARLKAFLKENKPAEDERLKIVSDNLKIKKQKIINDEQMNQFAKDFNSTVQEYMKEVSVYNEMVEDRANMNREAFEQKYNISEEGFRKTTTRLKNLAQSFSIKGREFDRMVGEYNMMKEQRGSTALLGGFFLSSLDMPREGLGSVLSGAYSQYAQLKSMIPAVKYNIGIGREEMKEKYPGKTIEEISDIIKKESDKDLKEELYGKDTYYVNPFTKQATALSREFNEGMKDYLRDFIVDITGGRVAEEKRTEKIKRESFVGGALLGLAESLPTFLLGAVGPALLMSDFVSEEMEKNPKFDNIPEDEKLIVANIIGTVGGFLEFYGLRNVFSQKGVFNNLIAGAINKFSTQGASTATKRSFAEFVKDDIQNKFVKGGALVVAGGLAEFETGAAQETVDIIVNNVYNDYVRNKEMFETPDIMSFEAVNAILYAGAQEAVGGKFMGAVNATVGLATGSLESGTDFEFQIFQELSQDPMTYDQYTQYLDLKVANGEINTRERDKKLKNYNQMNEAMQQFKDITGLDGMPQDISVDKQKDIVRLLVRRNKAKLASQNSKLSIIKNNKLAEANKIEKNIEELLTVEAELNAADQNEVIDPSKIGTDELTVYPEDTYDMTFQDQESVPEGVSSLEAQETQEAEDGSVTLTFSGQQLIDGGLATESKIEKSDETGSVSELFEVDEGVSAVGEQSEEAVEEYKNSAVKGMIDNAKKAFKKVLPNVKIILHRNDESFNKETTDESQKNDSGLTKIIDGQVYVHINQQRATGTTVGHEMKHALGVSEEKAAEIRSAIEGQIDPETKAELEAALDESGTKDNNQEYNSEYFGILTDNYRNATPTVKERIADFLQSLFDTFNIPIKINKTNDNEILDLLNTLARKVARGKKITKKEAAKIGFTLNTDGNTVRSQKVGARKIKPAEVKTRRVKVKSKKQIEKDANNLALVRSLRDKLKNTKLESEKKAIRKRIKDLKKRYRYRVEMAMITSIIADGRLTRSPETAIKEFLVNKLGYSASLVDRVMSIDKKYLNVMPDVFARTKKSIDLFKKVNAYRNKIVAANARRKGLTENQIEQRVEQKTAEIDAYYARYYSPKRLRRKKNETDDQYFERRTEYIEEIAAKRKKEIEDFRENLTDKNSKLLLPKSTDQISKEVIDFMRSQKEYPANQSDALVMDREIRKLIKTTAKVGKFIKIRQSTLMKKVSGMEIKRARKAVKEFVIEMLPSNVTINNKVVKELLKKIDNANTESIVPLVESDIMETITKLQVDKLKKDIKNLMKVKEVKLRDGRIVGVVGLPWQGNIQRVKDGVEQIDELAKKKDTDAILEYVNNLSERIEKMTLEKAEAETQLDEKAIREKVDDSVDAILLSYAKSMLVEDTNPTKINNLEDFKENFIQLYQSGRSALQEKIQEQKTSTAVDQIFTWISLTYGKRSKGNVFDGMTKDDVRAAIENKQKTDEAKSTSMSKINGLVAALPSTFFRGKKKQKKKYSELTESEKQRFRKEYPQFDEFFELTELVQSQYTQESDYVSKETKETEEAKKTKKTPPDFNLEEKTYKDLTAENQNRFDNDNTMFLDIMTRVEQENSSLMPLRTQGVGSEIRNVMEYIIRALNKYMYSNMAFYNVMDKLCKAPSIVMGQQFQQEFTNELDDASLMNKEGELYLNGVLMDAMERIIGKGWKLKARKYQSLNRKTAITFSEQYSMDEVNRDVRKMFPTAKNYNDLHSIDQESFRKKHQKYKIQTITLGQAAYWYNQYKNDETHAGFQKGNGFSDSSMKSIFLELKEKAPELVAFADWQVNEFFPSVYNRYNDVYKDLYFTNMEYSQKYAGRVYRENDKDQNYDIFDRMKNFDYVYGGPAQSKQRRKNANAIKKIDINKALFTYVRDMEYFRAYAKPLRKLNSVFGEMGPGKAKKQVTEAIDQMYGNSFRKFVNEYVAVINRNGATNDGGIFGAVQKAFVYGKIGGLSIPIFLKQLTSSVTYADDIGYINWGVNLLASTPELGLELARKITSGKYNPAFFINNFIPEYQTSVKEIFENSSYIKNRYDSNSTLLRSISSFSSSDLVQLFPDRAYKQFGADFGNFMLTLTREGDKAAIMLGGVPNYRFYKNEFKKKNQAQEGETQKEYEQRAIDYAIKKFEKDTKTTQQSSDVQDRDYFQTTDNVFVRGFSLFMTAQKQYLRKEVSGFQKIGRGIKNFRRKEVFEGLRTVFTYHMLAPALFQYVALALPGIARDWEEEDTDKLFWAALLGNFNSFFIAGDILNTIKDVALGYPWAGNLKLSPSLQVMADIGRNYKEYSNAKTDEKKKKYMFKMELLLGEVLGLPTSRTARFVDNYMKLYDDWETMPLGEKALRFANYSEYAINGGKIEKNAKKKRRKQKKTKKTEDSFSESVILDERLNFSDEIIDFSDEKID